MSAQSVSHYLFSSNVGPCQFPTLGFVVERWARIETFVPEDSFEGMQQMAKENNINFIYLRDEHQTVAKEYGAQCTPDPFLFNAQKQLVFHGKIDNAMKPDDTATEKTMINNMQKLLSGEKIENDFDPSIGCSIKWKEN